MRNVLVLQLTRLGDCLQTTPLLATWRHRHPQDHIAVLTHAAFARVFRPNPNVDDVIALEAAPSSSQGGSSSHGIPIHDCLQTIASRQRVFNCVVNLTHDHRSAALARALKPKEVFGIYADAHGHLRARDPWSRYLMSLLKFRSENPFNLVDCYAHLTGAPSSIDHLEFHLEPHDQSDASHLLRQAPPSKTWIGFQPGANSPDKRWPARRFAELARDLVHKSDAHIIILGNQDETPLAREITSGLPASSSTDLTGQTTLPQLAAVLQRCRLLVSNDTGTMHLAAAVGTRVIALFQSYVYHRETGPYGDGHWLIQASKLLEYGANETQDPGSLDHLPVSEVAMAVMRLLSEQRADERGSSDRLPEHQTIRGAWSMGSSHDLGIALRPLLNRQTAGGASDTGPVPTSQRSTLPPTVNDTYSVSPENGPSTASFDGTVRHLRSCFTAGHLDAVPARPVAAADDIEASPWIEVHRPIWLATLDGTPFVPQPSSAPDSLLNSSPHDAQHLTSCHWENLQKLYRIAAELDALLNHELERLRCNPTHRVSPDIAERLTRLEKLILHEQNDPACRPFVAYFEITTSTIEPRDLLSYLQDYSLAVNRLQSQLHYLSLSLSLSLSRTPSIHDSASTPPSRGISTARQSLQILLDR